MDIDQQELAEISKKHHLMLVLLYGSQADGTASEKSDYDIAVLANKRINYKKHFEIQDELKKVLSIKSAEKVDLVDLRTAPPLLVYQIAKNYQKLYGSDREEDRFYRQAVARYLDAKPLFEATKDYLNNYVRRHATGTSEV